MVTRAQRRATVYARTPTSRRAPTSTRASRRAGTPDGLAAPSPGGSTSVRALSARAPRLRPVCARQSYLRMTNDGNLGLAALLTGETNTASHAFREKLELSGETVVRPVFKAPCPGRRRSGGGRRRARGNTRRGADAHRYDQAENPVEKRLDETFFDPARARCGTRPWDTAVRDGSTLRFEDAIACASRDGTPGSARTAKLRHEQGATLAHDSQLTAGPVRARLAAKAVARTTISRALAGDEQRARGGAGATPTSLLHPCKAAVTARLSPSMLSGTRRPGVFAACERPGLFLL
jgi:hypothetical protein